MFPFALSYLITALLHQAALSLPTTAIPAPITLHQPAHNPQSSNTTTLLPLPPSTYTAPDPHLSHRFRVPNTDTILHLGFSYPRTSLPPAHLHTLLKFASGIISNGIHTHGRQGIYPLGAPGKQSFAYGLGDGIALEVCNTGAGDLLTWEDLEIVVRGLELFLVEGRRAYVTRFRFWRGEGPVPDVGGEGKGWGRVFRERAEREGVRAVRGES